MREEVLWSDYDHWSYEDPQNPRAPPYSLYTGLNAKWTLVTFIALLFLHALAVFLTELFTSAEFRKEKGSKFQKAIHIITNTNMPTPYRDWDHEDVSVEEHRMRHKKTEREMICLSIVNTGFSLMLLVPLWYTGESLMSSLIVTED